MNKDCPSCETKGRVVGGPHGGDCPDYWECTNEDCRVCYYKIGTGESSGS